MIAMAHSKSKGKLAKKTRIHSWIWVISYDSYDKIIWLNLYDPDYVKTVHSKLNRFGRFNKLTDWALWYFIEWRHGLFFIQVLIQNASSEFQCIKAIVACHRLIQNFHDLSPFRRCLLDGPVRTLFWRWLDSEKTGDSIMSIVRFYEEWRKSRNFFFTVDEAPRRASHHGP